jgi:uncharacterized membrane protein YcgQ (UPF0703/DUF1980 family)
MNTSVKKKVVCFKLGNSSRMAIFVIYPLNFHSRLRSQHENTKHQQKQKQDEAKHKAQRKTVSTNKQRVVQNVVDVITSYHSCYHGSIERSSALPVTSGVDRVA